MVQILKPIKKEISILEKILSKIIRQTDNIDLISYFKYTDQSLKGKRLRPALLIIAANLSKKNNELNKQNILSAAAALELFHLASLVHDDVVDESSQRHNLPTIYKKFGRDQAIILGSRLIALGFAELNKCNNQAVRKIITQALIEICDGQLLQIKNRHNFNLSQTEYYTIIQKKTSALFIAATVAGSYLNKKKFLKPLTRYALNLGLAFQIINDLTDITAKKNSLGKDIMMGEITLPLILLRDNLNKPAKKELTKKLNSRQSIPYQQIKQQLIKNHFIARSKQIAEEHLHVSRQCLKTLPQNRLTKILFQITLLVAK